LLGVCKFKGKRESRQRTEEGQEPKTKEGRHEALGKIAWRRVLLNIFLVGSTISFTFSTWGTLAYVGDPVPEKSRQGWEDS